MAHQHTSLKIKHALSSRTLKTSDNPDFTICLSSCFLRLQFAQHDFTFSPQVLRKHKSRSVYCIASSRYIPQTWLCASYPCFRVFRRLKLTDCHFFSVPRSYWHSPALFSARRSHISIWTDQLMASLHRHPRKLLKNRITLITAGLCLICAWTKAISQEQEKRDGSLCVLYSNAGHIK